MKALLAVLLFALAGKSAAWTFSDGRHPTLREPMREYALELKNTDKNSYYNGVIRLRAIGPSHSPRWEVLIELRWLGELMCNALRERCWIEFIGRNGSVLGVDVRPGHRYTAINDSRTAASIIAHLSEVETLQMKFKVKGGFAHYRANVTRRLDPERLYLK